jgi:hypothetical protein
MSDAQTERLHLTVARLAAWAVAFLGAIYVVVTGLGLLALPSPDVPIPDPFFTLMEMLILIMAPLMVMTMAAVYIFAAPGVRCYALLSLVFVAIMAGLTSCVHVVVLTVGDQIAATPGGPLLVSFTWPSVVYALDILAWDWFFALAMLCVAPVFRSSGVEGTLRTLMVACGVLSLAGLVGVPLGNMAIRNIGIVGYGLLAPAVFFLLGLVLGQPRALHP